MRWNKYKYLYIIVIQFTLVLAGHFFTGSDNLTSSMWPAIGFSAIFYLNDKKSLLPILIGTLLGHLTNQLFLLENTISLAIGLSMFFSIVSILEIVIFKLIYFTTMKKISFKNSEIVSLFIAFLISSIIGGIIVGTTFFIFDQQSLINIGSKWAMGDFFGMAIFSTIMFYVYKIDKRFIQLSWKSVLLVVFYILFSFYIFTKSSDSRTYLQFVILFIPFYVIASVYFRFSIFIVLNLIHIVMFQIYYVDLIDTQSLNRFFINLNVVLLVFTFISIFLKLILIEFHYQEALVIEKNNRLNKVMTSIHRFFNLSSGFDSTLESFDKNYMKSIFTLAKEMFENFDGGSCYIADGEYIKFTYGEGIDIDILNELKFKSDEFSFKINQPILHQISNEDIARLIGRDQLQTYVESTPVIVESVYMGFYLSDGKLGGVSFDIFHGSNYRFTKQDIEVFESFQKTMNDLYKSSVLVKENQSLKNSVVMGLVRAINLYDNYTKGHCEDVSYVAKEIAMRMNFNSRQVDLIEVAGLLHDVGKLGIPRKILNKPARLTDEEYEVIKQHPQLGADILSDLPDMQDVASYILYHHERWDGKGYPMKLKEDEIPLGAQIIGVCDAACSMLEGRVYAAKKSVKDVIDELKKFRGTQFAPAPTDILIEMLDNPKIVKKILAFYKEN